ncbi:MAG: hypothetical protein ABSH52_02265 [Terriglobia bacterium]
MNRRLTTALILAMLLAMLHPSLATAQTRGGHFAGAPAPRTSAPYRGGARTGFGARGGRGFYRRGDLFFPGYFSGYGYSPLWDYYSLPLYADYDYGYDYGYDNGYEPMAAQAPPPWLATTHSETFSAPARPAEPVVLERQGDQWVRIGEYGQQPASVGSPAPGAAPAPNPTSESAEWNTPAQRAPKLPPAVLVFRDGHQEEIEKYTIIGPVIYAQADYWSTGSWRRKVAIADLDIPATLKLNQERGGKFSLPSGPNEVIFRP